MLIRCVGYSQFPILHLPFPALPPTLRPQELVSQTVSVMSCALVSTGLGQQKLQKDRGGGVLMCPMTWADVRWGWAGSVYMISDALASLVASQPNDILINTFSLNSV